MSENSPKRIIVIEDEPDLRSLYAQILKDEGYVVETAADGEEGLSKLSKNTYDLVLLDIILPIMDGLQILEALSISGKGPLKNVVLLTNIGQDLVIAKAIGYGVRGYMIKSDYTPDELLKEVQGYIANEQVKSSIS